MTIEMIKNRLDSYKVSSKEEEFNALKEIFQEIALCALSRTDFFKNAAFMGGTCLRILHKLPRFSEDLDFALLLPDSKFRWTPLLNRLSLEFQTYDLYLSVLDRSEAKGAVKKAFLKDDSFGKVLELTYERTRADIQKIMIKLEIDINPPIGSKTESLMVRFPYPFTVRAHDLNSLCAGKCLAILCRKFHKGRDWYDFLWYVSNNVMPNFELISNGIKKNGPWENKGVQVEKLWLLDALHSKVDEVDWNAARNEVKPFLSSVEAKKLASWDKNYFHNCVDLFLG